MLLLRSSTGALFLSTLSLRRATIATKYSWSGFSISIHALLAESDQLQKIGKCACPISIHALLAESDLPTGGQTFDINLFLSTLSLRRATFNGVHGHISGDISIHALLAESDCGYQFVAMKDYIFLSTLSLRRATIQIPNLAALPQFLSTLSLRRATLSSLMAASYRVRLFLSTLSLRRATRRLLYILCGAHDFYPRSPCGERPFGGLQAALSGDFYPRSPCGERPTRI